MTTQTLIDKTQIACDILGLDRGKVKSVIMHTPPDGNITVDVVFYPDSDEIAKLMGVFCGSETRPSNCRNRLRDEGKAYPRSGCGHCKTGGMTGCPNEQR